MTDAEKLTIIKEMAEGWIEDKPSDPFATGLLARFRKTRARAGVRIMEVIDSKAKNIDEWASSLEVIESSEEKK